MILSGLPSKYYRKAQMISINNVIGLKLVIDGTYISQIWTKKDIKHVFLVETKSFTATETRMKTEVEQKVGRDRKE